MKTEPRRVEYCPPADTLLDTIVTEASQRLAATQEEADYAAPDVVYGLSAFIKLIARLKANELNRLAGDDFDKPDATR